MRKSLLGWILTLGLGQEASEPQVHARRHLNTVCVCAHGTIHPNDSRAQYATRKSARRAPSLGSVASGLNIELQPTVHSDDGNDDEVWKTLATEQLLKQFGVQQHMVRDQHDAMCHQLRRMMIARRRKGDVTR